MSLSLSLSLLLLFLLLLVAVVVVVVVVVDIYTVHVSRLSTMCVGKRRVLSEEVGDIAGRRSAEAVIAGFFTPKPFLFLPFLLMLSAASALGLTSHAMLP